MKSLWNRNNKRRSLAVPVNSDDSPYSESFLVDPNDPHDHRVRNLAKQEYDVRSLKHSWINAVLSASTAHDISEQTLKLYRVELKGSHLHIYKAPPLLSVRLYRVEAPEQKTDEKIHFPGPRKLSVASIGSDSVSVSAPTAISMPSVATNGTTILGNSTLLGNSTPVLESVGNGSSLAIPGITTYLEPSGPHPGLCYDSETNTFLPGTTVEAMVHYFLFGENPTSILLLVTVLPMLPRFGDVLKLMYIYLTNIFDGKFGTVDSPGQIVDRVIRLFEHLDRNFSGFLLKSDVAPSMLKILELFTELAPPESADLLAFFKTTMLSRQQMLIGLVNSTDAVAPVSSTDNPFVDLNSAVFMNDVNLFDLATSITALDLEFFNAWNSSTDKSLLLYSSIGDSTSSDFFYKKNPLIFNNDTHIHYLSRLLVHHLFVETPNATPEKRARILEKWIDLGCLLDKSGNMSSWLGISSIILSQPVLRLTMVWSYVSTEYIKLLKNDWSPVLFELDRRHLANSYEHINFGPSSSSGKGDSETEFSASKESYHIMAPRGLGKIYPKEMVIPYFGDLIINNSSSTNITELETVWKKINYSFDRWNDYLKNLFNSSEIIKYNQDVLKRYNTMGLIFSNESLNQVLYLGFNKDDDKNVPASIRAASSGSETSVPELVPPSKKKMRTKLLRLLEVNCESISLEFVMKYSLELEPTLPEKYLKEPAQQNNLGLQKFALLNNSSSNLSVSSGSSANSTNALEYMDLQDGALTLNSTSISEVTPEDKLPTFNNQFFKINLLKYDDLASSSTSAVPKELSSERYNIVVDNDLTLRIDDFVNDFEQSVTTSNSTYEDGDHIEVEDDGLGIDVDDILNSEKFQNFSITEEAKHDNNPSALVKRHRSFGLISVHSDNRNSVQASKYIPRFATIDKLVDLLLIDSKYFDKAHNIDLNEYRFVFMLNYSSFITTKDLLDMLAHRFVHSGNAVISVMKRLHFFKNETFDPATFGSFPNWDVDNSLDLSELGDVDYELLLKIQVNILKALIVLINNFYSNFSNDLRNKKTMIKLLKLYSNEILQWYNSNKIDKDLDKSFESLVNYYKKLKKLFMKKTYRPIEPLKFESFLVHEFKFSNTLQEVPMNRNLPSHKNIHKIEKFLNKFNKLLTVFYKGIKPEDWFKTFKILENQFETQSLLEYSLQRTTVGDDTIIISNVFNYFESLIDPVDKELILKKLPLVFTKLFKLYCKFRSYLLIQLCDVNISLEERLDRMKTLLIMIKISKLKMSDSQFVFEGDHDNIPSCIETAIINVVYSPESRVFSNLWLKASNALNASNQDFVANTFTDVSALLPLRLKQSDLLMGHDPLLPCFGWIIENLIEVNKCPTFHRSTINFNKRYLIFKLIKELSVEDLDDNDEVQHDTREFEFLLKLNETFSTLAALKDHNGLERQKINLFKTVIREQYSILVADGRKKAMKHYKTPILDPASAVQPTKKTSANALRRQSLTYKTNASSRFKITGLFNKQRGLSNSNSERVVDFKELPDPSAYADVKQKPFLTMILKEKKIFPVYVLPFCFKIDLEGSTDTFFFQAHSEIDCKDWVMKLDFANRHWFFSRAINFKSNHYFTTFGVPLQTVCNRDKASSPVILDMMYHAIEKDGLKDVGIYRISTSLSEMNSIKQEIDKTGLIDFDERGVNVNALTSCVKMYFRELPDALLTDLAIESFFQLKGTATESAQEKFSPQPYRDILDSLPKPNYFTLRGLIGHLNKVLQNSDMNLMTASNLATVIGPALTEASNLDSLINNFGFMNFILEKLIENYDVIFDEDF